MGLMYIFPVNDDGSEGPQVEVKETHGEKQLVLKTFGLPMVFWGYLVAALSVVALMWLASRPVITKLVTYEDPALNFLGHLVQWSLILTPIILLAFFFFEKSIVKHKQGLTLIYKIFFIPVWQKKFELTASDAFSVEHFMDSPNMAKIKNQYRENKEALKHFENKGYFELCIETTLGKKRIDRHTRKADLVKMKDLLSRY